VGGCKSNIEGTVDIPISIQRSVAINIYPKHACTLLKVNTVVLIERDELPLLTGSKSLTTLVSSTLSYMGRYVYHSFVSIYFVG